MSEFTKDEILKLDEILKFLNNNKNSSFDEQFLAKKFNITLEKYLFLYNEICNFSSNEPNIGNVLNKGKHYQSLECDYHTERFISDGGFEQYYRLKKERVLENNKPNVISENYIAGDNFGTQYLDRSLKKPKIKKTIAAPVNNPVTKSLFKRIYSDPWLIGISLAILALILSAERINEWINGIIDKI